MPAPSTNNDIPVLNIEVELPLDSSMQRQTTGFLAPGQTKIALNMDSISTTTTLTVPLPTPPLGKLFYVTDLSITHSVSTAQRFALVTGGVVVFSTLVHGSAAPDIFNALETQIDMPGNATCGLTINGTTSQFSYANILGIQQNL